MNLPTKITVSRIILSIILIIMLLFPFYQLGFNFPIYLVEGIKVDSLERERLDTHMNKVLTRYDPNGCPYAFLIIYTTVQRFDLGYENIFNYFKAYEYPFPSETELMDMDTGYGELKHAQIILNRNGQKIRVHIWVAHI